MENKKLLRANLVLSSLVLLFLFTSFLKVDVSRTVSSYLTKRTDSLSQIVHSLDLSKDYFLAGEFIPIHIQEVRERLDRELVENSYRHSRTILNIKKANKYFPIIEPILAEEGVPDDMKYLAIAESDLMNATSSAGAKGIWQFMKATGREYGMQVNDEVDERYHIEKATRAAARYLKSKKEKLGTWAFAMAAYNAGTTGVKNAIAKQKAQSYFDLNMSQETTRYYFRIAAIKEIMQHPERYGFYLDDSELYPPMTDFNIVTVDTTIENLGDFANKYGISYRILKVYNPWLRRHKLTNTSGKEYEIKIPKITF
ncbi:MAG: lytic transglycosylase domain-containing protein [Bacteroidia bacterium]|nr:lytic transglycosylase domain-containing protein [Bacteroidia bacterium]